jgi:uncharacterized protein YciI
MKISTTTKLRLGLAVSAATLALPVGTAAAHHTSGPAEYGVIERQCEAHKGHLFTNTYDGLRLICSGPDFKNGAMPAQMACERMDGAFTIKGIDEPGSWICHFPAGT